MKLLRTLCLLLALVASGLHPFAVFAAGPEPAPRLTLAGRIGGSSLAVAVRDGYAFVGQSAEFTVVDVRDTQHPQRLAYLPLAANDIALHGNYAYVTNKEGLAAIDIAQLADPRQTAFQPTPQALTALTVAGEYVYAVAPRAGLFVYDIRQPAQPHAVGFLHQPNGEGVAAQDEVVYLATSTGLQIVTAADPAQPALLATLATGPLEAVAVSGHYAYMTATTGALLIADVADPAAPALAAAISLPTYTKGLYVMGDMAYVANGANGLAAVDVRDPSRPHLIGVQAVGTLVTDVFANGDSIWATDVYDGGLHILRSSPSGAPAEVAAYRVPGVAQDAAVGGHYAYLVSGKDAGIAIVDLTDPSRLAGAGFYQTPARTAVVRVDGNRLYALDAHNTLQVLDISDPVHPTPLGTRDLARSAEVIAAQGNLFFVNDGTGLLHVFDVAGEGLPQEIGTLAASVAIHDAIMTDDYLLAAAGVRGVLLARRSAAGQPAQAEVVAIPGSAQRVAAAGDYGYVMTSSGDLITLDLSAPGPVRITGRIALGITAREIAADNRRIYLAADDAGVYVVETAPAATADSAVPTRVLVYDTPGAALHIEVAGSTILVADGFAGLLLLNMEN